MYGNLNLVILKYNNQNIKYGIFLHLTIDLNDNKRTKHTNIKKKLIM